MARKKKSSKAAAPRLPKHIAGVKVPKALREPGGRLLAAMSDPVMMDLAAAALAAAASAWVQRLETSGGRRDRPAPETANDPAGGTAEGSARA